MRNFLQVARLSIFIFSYSLIQSAKDCGLFPVIVQLFSEQINCVSGSCAQGIVSVLILVVSRSDPQVVYELYDAGERVRL